MWSFSHHFCNQIRPLRIISLYKITLTLSLNSSSKNKVLSEKMPKWMLNLVCLYMRFQTFWSRNQFKKIFKITILINNLLLKVNVNQPKLERCLGELRVVEFLSPLWWQVITKSAAFLKGKHLHQLTDHRLSAITISKSRISLWKTRREMLSKEQDIDKLWNKNWKSSSSSRNVNRKLQSSKTV